MLCYVAHSRRVHAHCNCTDLSGYPTAQYVCTTAYAVCQKMPTTTTPMTTGPPTSGHRPNDDRTKRTHRSTQDQCSKRHGRLGSERILIHKNMIWQRPKRFRKNKHDCTSITFGTGTALQCFSVRTLNTYPEANSHTCVRGLIPRSRCHNMSQTTDKHDVRT